MKTQIDLLEWDSNFLNIPTARIYTDSIDATHIAKELQVLKNKNIKLVYLITPQPFTPDTFRFELKNVGGKVLYHKALTKAQPAVNEAIEAFKNSVPDKTLYNLALQSGIYSRFKLDEKLPANCYEKLYNIWIENSVNKSIADEVLIYNVKDQTAGMVTLGTNKQGWGDIGLIAVDNNFRGQKIGQALVTAAQEYFIRKNISDLGVETQIDNKAACHFYEKMGFKAIQTEFINHFWL
jgi:dTDP-4-amino-4,6-dideoxy-D-galactose acyltransferase